MSGNLQKTLFFEINISMRNILNCLLNWKINPVPTRHSKELLQQSSSLPAAISIIKPPPKRVLQEDVLQSFCDKDFVEVRY